MKISIHRALSELKLLDKKIEQKIEKNAYIGFKKKSKQEINGISVKEFKEGIKSNQESVEKLIENRIKIKSAIDVANANNEIEISGIKMTVVQALAMKTSIILKENLLSKYILQYNSSISTVERENYKVDNDSEDFVKELMKNMDKLDTTKIKNLKEDYIKSNSFELIDSNNLKEKIDKLEKEIEDFKNNVDYALSESNAINKIEIEL